MVVGLGKELCSPFVLAKRKQARADVGFDTKKNSSRRGVFYARQKPFEEWQRCLGLSRIRKVARRVDICVELRFKGIDGCRRVAWLRLQGFEPRQSSVDLGKADVNAGLNLLLDDGDPCYLVEDLFAECAVVRIELLARRGVFADPFLKRVPTPNVDEEGPTFFL